MRFKLTIIGLLLLLVLVFAIQNAAVVEIRLLVWEFEFPRSLLIFLMLLIGMVVGWFSRAAYRLSRNR